MIERKYQRRAGHGRRRPLRIAAKAAIAGLALACVPGRALAWSSNREHYPNSIREVATATGGAGAPGRPAMVRTDLSPAEHRAQMTVEVALRMRNLTELRDRIARGELISGTEMDAKYFPLQADYDRVVQWVKDQGFSVARTDADKLAVFARGSVDTAAAAFQVAFARVSYRGAEFTSAVTAPSLPAELSPTVLGIHGLQPHLRSRPLVHLGAQSGSTPYVPSQILTAYGWTPASGTGSGQTIAMIEQAEPSETDISMFWQVAGVDGDSLSNIKFKSIGLGPDTAASVGEANYEDEVTEASLDAEWASGTAPGAVIRIYSAGSVDPGAFDEAYQQVYADSAGDLGMRQLSLSFGLNEDDMDHDYFLIESQYMANLTAAGVTVFAASGDGGSNPDPTTGNYNSSAPLQVEYPASDPSVTGVGGTALYLYSNNAREKESGWLDGGGGVSTIYARPSWQTGPGVPTGGYRLVPDVAATADPILGALIVQGQNQTTVGGTSWATPVWAAICAMINQARASASLSAVGFLNPKLYPLQGGSSFFDIVTGGNAGFPAGPGYDSSTGLGAPDITQLISQLTQGSGAAGSLVIIDQLGSQYAMPGQTATFAVVTYPPAAANVAVPQNPSFQWQMKSGSTGWVNLADGSTYQGSNTPFLSVSDVTTAMQGESFLCVVTDGSSTVTSNPASLNVIASGVTTLAGWPEAAGSADGLGREARFDYVGSLRLDSEGNIFVADGGNNEIRKVTPAGVVTTVAGVAGTAGSADGPASTALFNSPGGVAVDPSGNIFVADSGNYTVREVSTSGVVTTVAGSVGVQGTANGSGTNAQFYDMEDIAADGQGNLYVADGMNDVIRKVVIATQTVTNFAGKPGLPAYADGPGSVAQMNDPTGVCTDSLGNVYFSDTGNNLVRMITPAGEVSTIAGAVGQSGSQDGPAKSATFNGPAGLGVDSQGDLFVTDAMNFTIREISAKGTVSTVAGQVGVQENVDGPLLSADFAFPVDLAVNSAGTIYVADGTNNTVRQIVVGTPAVAINVQPASQTINQGSTVVMTGGATGATSYQWLFNGNPVSNSSGGGGATDVVNGATGPQLVISNVTSASAGSYSLEAMGPGGGPATSSSASLTVTNSSNPGAVTSLSARAFVGTGNDILIGGFYIVGDTSATVLVQALGPALAASPFNVTGVLEHPTVAIHQYQNGNDVVLYQDTGWGSSQVLLNAAAAVYAQPVLSPGSADSELLVTLPPGGYTAEVVGADGGTGVALCGIYQLP